MRRMAATALILLTPAQVHAACAGLDPVTATVSIETGEPAEPRIVAASAEEIGSRAARTGAGLPGGAATRGLTVDELGAQARFTLASVTRDGQRCTALKAIEATVRNHDVEVLVDSDYGPGSCQYRAIMEHERQHVRINAEALTRLGELLEAKLGEVAARWDGRWVPAGREDELQAEVDGALEDATRQARAAAEERHRVLDTPESYAQVQASCDSW